MLAATAKPPDLMGSAEQHKELVFPLLLLFLVFLYTNTVIPGFHFFFLPLSRKKGWKLQRQSEQSSGCGKEDPQAGLTTGKGEPGPASCCCSVWQISSAVLGGPFEFLCLISHVYSEANNAAFVCPIYLKCNEMRFSKMTNGFQCLVRALSWRRRQKWPNSLLLSSVAWRGFQAVSAKWRNWAVQAQTSAGFCFKLFPLSLKIKFSNTNVSYQLALVLPEKHTGTEPL